MASLSRRTPKRVAGQGAPHPEQPSATIERGAPDWLLNLLTVSGPAGEVARFRTAAQGTGGVPWHLDLDHEKARLFAPMVAAEAEARMLARQIREIQAARHDGLMARQPTVSRVVAAHRGQMSSP